MLMGRRGLCFFAFVFLGMGVREWGVRGIC